MLNCERRQNSFVCVLYSTCSTLLSSASGALPLEISPFIIIDGRLRHSDDWSCVQKAGQQAFANLNINEKRLADLAGRLVFPCALATHKSRPPSETKRRPLMGNYEACWMTQPAPVLSPLRVWIANSATSFLWPAAWALLRCWRRRFSAFDRAQTRART